MCGRFGQHLTWRQINALYGLTDAPAPNAYRERWNAAPSQDLAVLRHNPETGARSADLLRWGLVPHWAKDPKIAFKTINARAETIASAASFRAAFAKGRRAVVPANGFYEWKAGPEGKQPYWITRADGVPLSLAALWEGWRDPDSGEWLRSFTIVTTEANELLAPLHTRMPVILDEADIPAWLGEAPATPEALQALLRPFPSERLTLWPVDRKVGNVRNEGPELIEPIG